MISRKALMGSGAGGLTVDDVFSTDLYTGNNSSQNIVNGIDLSGEGGLVWVKSRSFDSFGPFMDTERGIPKYLRPNASTAEESNASYMTSYNTDGFSLGSGPNVNFAGSSETFVSWTFRKAPKFFDVVTYTGNGVAGRTIAHGLGVEAGIIFIKKTDGTSDWYTAALNSDGNYQTSTWNNSGGVIFSLNNNSASPDVGGAGGVTTDEVFNLTLGGLAATSVSFTNNNGSEYVAYLFAHDTEDDSMIKCGSYTGNGSATGPVVTLGWEPQWLIYKRTDSASNWAIWDNQRSTSNPRNKILFSDATSAELTNTAYNYDFNATGFQVKTSNATYNASGGTYIYMAIRAEE